MISFDLNNFLWILYLGLVYIGITLIYALIVTDYFMRIWERKRISNMRNVLIVTAHPDDECMFFGPSTVAFGNADCNVFLICLSRGDHEGIGEIRAQELWGSCKKLGIKPGNVVCFNHHYLRDDPEVLWKPSHIAGILTQSVHALDIDTLITFDEYGVSGHLNHISIYNCVKELIEKRQFPPKCRVFALESVSWFRKYILGVFDVYLSYATSKYMYVTNENGRSRIRAAMEAHTSQYVWYRKLYMVFSRYINVNTFRELRHSSVEKNDPTKRRKFPLFRNSQQQQKSD